MPTPQKRGGVQSILLNVKIGCVFLTKVELFLSKAPNDCALRAQNQNARVGKKEGGWGEGIFARPRFPPPPNFVFCFAKCAAENLICLKFWCNIIISTKKWIL